mgnify:CR=1 FL=1
MVKKAAFIKSYETCIMIHKTNVKLLKKAIHLYSIAKTDRLNKKPEIMITITKVNNAAIDSGTNKAFCSGI